jgi:mono/diheme cytochrome c family protein
MQFSSKKKPQQGQGRRLFLLAAICLLATGAQAQNLDFGKSAKRLFADSCVACHHSARGLARGRFRLTLFMFLKEHYSTNSSAAWELASYLESVDVPQRGRSRSAANTSSTAVNSGPGSAPRPPLPVPIH